MTEPGGSDSSPQPAQLALEGTVTGSGTASGDLTVRTGITYSQTQSGEWDAKRAKQEHQAEKELRQQAEIERQAEFDRHEAAANNKQRREFQQDMFRLVEGVIVAAVILSILVIAFADNPDTKEKAWSLLTLIVGGVVGGAVGYMTGKSSK
jgi:hypothetical protein